MRLPIGYDNFYDIINKNLNFVDKSLLIKDFLDDEIIQVILITRPRRFGKTLNLSMLQHFFAAEVNGNATRNLFTDLKIAQQGEAYMRHQGQYPVIAVTFKDVKGKDFASIYAKLSYLLSNVFQQHSGLLESDKLSELDKDNFNSVLQRTATQETLEDSLLFLSRCLYQHYEKQVILLIDEYDAPIESSYIHGCYDEMINFMRNMFGAALKSNPYLHRAFMTGILRISKESLFSGLNNIKVHSILSTQYSEYYGFTEDEVTSLLTQANLAQHYEQIKRWYNGYIIGTRLIYNPWSIVNCIYENGRLDVYWINTSNNVLIKTLLMQSNTELKEEFELLLQGIATEQVISENFVFGDLSANPAAIWSLLLASGYLKATSRVAEGIELRCQLLAPNKEIELLYETIFRQWFTDKTSSRTYQQFITSLLEGDIERFRDKLSEYLIITSSQFDATGKEPEKFYHGLVLGLVASLHETHQIKSNRESGYGRYDVMLIPKDTNKLGIILEFKSVADATDLNAEAQEALKQINHRDYAAELRQAGISKILKLGLAFKGKQVAVLAEDWLA